MINHLAYGIPRIAKCLRFAHYLENRVDAHVDNFMVEKSTGIIVLIDTEHFPTMVGLKEPFEYDDYPPGTANSVVNALRIFF